MLGGQRDTPHEASGLPKRTCSAPLPRTARMNQAEFTCSVQPSYLEEQSDPSCHEHLLTVTIVNSGTVTAQLIARHWVITDAMGRRGSAWAGRGGQPALAQAGERFEYTSWTRLNTPHGTMQGPEPQRLWLAGDPGPMRATSRRRTCDFPTLIATVSATSSRDNTAAVERSKLERTRRRSRG